ncbi:MAG: acyltransferase family protein [Candidatus Limivicinus sp.]|jgi:hypothetical protein
MEFTKRDTKILKGVAICLMLCHHLFGFPDRVVDGNSFISLCSFGETALSTYIGQFGRICIPMFTFLGGYGVYLLSCRSENQGQMILKRISGLYKSFWMVFLICVPVSVFAFKLVPEPIFRELIYNFFGLSISFNGEWWYIVPYVILLLMFPALKRFLERKNASLPSDTFILVLFNAAVVYLLPALADIPLFSELCGSLFWYRIKLALGLLPAFALGAVFAKYDLLAKIKAQLGGRVLWCILSIVGMAALFYIHLYNFMYYDFINTALFVICLVILMPTKPGIFLGGIFEKLGEESTFMWLIHTFFCYYWCQKLVYAPKYSPLIFLWLLILSFLSAKLIRLFYRGLGLLYSRLFRKSAANT